MQIKFESFEFGLKFAHAILDFMSMYLNLSEGASISLFDFERHQVMLILICLFLM